MRHSNLWMKSWKNKRTRADRASVWLDVLLTAIFIKPKAPLRSQSLNQLCSMDTGSNSQCDSRTLLMYNILTAKISQSWLCATALCYIHRNGIPKGCLRKMKMATTAQYHHQMGSPKSIMALPIMSGSMQVQRKPQGARNSHSAMHRTTAKQGAAWNIEQQRCETMPVWWYWKSCRQILLTIRKYFLDMPPCT